VLDGARRFEITGALAPVVSSPGSLVPAAKRGGSGSAVWSILGLGVAVAAALALGLWWRRRQAET